MIRLIKKHKKLVKFCIVGASGALIDLSALVLIVEIFQTPVLVANTISFLLAATNNFFLNKFWTFGDNEKKYWSKFFKFLFIALIGLSLNLLLMSLFIGDGFHYIPAKLLIIAIVGLWNFSANNFWTFRHVTEKKGINHIIKDNIS